MMLERGGLSGCRGMGAGVMLEFSWRVVQDGALMRGLVALVDGCRWVFAAE
jgi:hypothetical protein